MKSSLLKQNLIKVLLISLSLLIIYSCTTSRTSTIVSTSYDKNKNLTTHMVFPYGSIEIPNKWEKIGYINSSRQYILMNEDSIMLYVLFGTTDKYSFNEDKSLEGYDFLKAFYKWKADYFEKELALKNEIIEENRDKNYIIFRIFGDKINTIILIYENNKFITSLSIQINSKWSDDQKVDFLKSLINTNY